MEIYEKIIVQQKIYAKVARHLLFSKSRIDHKNIVFINFIVAILKISLTESSLKKVNS